MCGFFKTKKSIAEILREFELEEAEAKMHWPYGAFKFLSDNQKREIRKPESPNEEKCAVGKCENSRCRVYWILWEVRSLNRQGKSVTVFLDRPKSG